jgi:hypothetical protein
MNSKRTQRRFWPRAVALIGLTGCSFSQIYAGTVYSQDPTLQDFTDTVTSYATFSTGYQPTTAILLAANYPRVVGNTSSPINVSFTSPTNTIVAFDNIDHPGYGWDVFQYQILGSTDGTTYTLLFDPQAVNEANNPGANSAFTLKTFTGTAPTLLNNTITPGLGSAVGNVGYEEYFTFSNSYSFFRFAPSTLTLTAAGGENETELSAVGIGTPSAGIIGTATPEPASFLFVGAGLAAWLASVRRRNLKIEKRM